MWSLLLQRLLLAEASLVADHKPLGALASGLVDSEDELNNCGAQGLVAPQDVGSSWIRDRTCVSCTGNIFTTEPPGKPQKCF